VSLQNERKIFSSNSLINVVYSFVCLLSEQIISLLTTALENPVTQNEEDAEQKVALLVFTVTALSAGGE